MKAVQPTPNRLIHEKSSYLLQHAHNPVDWHPWGQEALARARQEDKPIFLSIGYAACHWCHVMARESFEDQGTADLLNEHFVCIKVDRQERPDLDELYMGATQLITGQGGWPNSVFLTPEGKPWFAGTYFPPEDMGERPGFRTLLRSLHQAWLTRREDIEKQAQQLWEAIGRLMPTAQESRPTLELSLVEPTITALRGSFDSKHGGFGGAPKFPPHGAIALLLATHRRTGQAHLLEMVTKTLDAMSAGGIRDHLGGGFHRYSTDDRWLVPHFEKMLYDNAQLARNYALAFGVTGNQAYRQVAVEILDWALREMVAPGGGFHSGIDADSEGQEGLFYLWRHEEVMEVLGADGELFCRVYSVEPRGNFMAESRAGHTGLNVLYLARPMELTARVEQMGLDELEAKMRRCRQSLLEWRNGRGRPQTDTQLLASWNGLMIGALAAAGTLLRQRRYVEAAQRAAEFVLTQMRSGQRLIATWRDGPGRPLAYLDDYACTSLGLLALHEATGETRWRDEAVRLMDVLEAHYADPAGGYFFTADDQKDMPVRMKLPFDQAVPSGNGATALALVKLAELTGDQRYLERARRCLDACTGIVSHAPRGCETLLLAVEAYFAALAKG